MRRILKAPRPLQTVLGARRVPGGSAIEPSSQADYPDHDDRADRRATRKPEECISRLDRAPKVKTPAQRDDEGKYKEDVSRHISVSEALGLTAKV